MILKLLKMEEEHDIVHFPQSYSRSISVNRGVHTVQRDNKIKSCPLQESLFHLSRTLSEKYSTTEQTQLFKSNNSSKIHKGAVSFSLRPV